MGYCSCVKLFLNFVFGSEQSVPLAKISGLLEHSSVNTTFEYYCDVMDENEKIRYESTEQKFGLLCTFLVVYDIIEIRVIGKY